MIINLEYFKVLNSGKQLEIILAARDFFQEEEIIIINNGLGKKTTLSQFTDLKRILISSGIQWHDSWSDHY